MRIATLTAFRDELEKISNKKIVWDDLNEEQKNRFRKMLMKYQVLPQAIGGVAGSFILGGSGGFLRGNLAGVVAGALAHRAIKGHWTTSQAALDEAYAPPR